MMQFIVEFLIVFVPFVLAYFIGKIDGKPHIKYNKSGIKFVAIDSVSQNILASGTDPNKVMDKAHRSGKDFLLTYEFDQSKTFIF